MLGPSTGPCGTPGNYLSAWAERVPSRTTFFFCFFFFFFLFLPIRHISRSLSFPYVKMFQFVEKWSKDVARKELFLRTPGKNLENLP